MTRYTQTGRNSWAAKSGYKHSPDVPGPLSKEPRPIISFLGQVMAVGLLFGSAWLLIVAFSS